MKKNISNKIRIMCIAECAGGVERYLQGLIKYIDHNKFEIIAILSHKYDKSKLIDRVDNYEFVDMAHEIGSIDIKTIFEIRQVIKKYHPDIVYAHSSKAGALTRMANLGLHIPCIYNPHGWSFNMQ